MNPRPLPKRTPCPTRARCPLCAHVVGVYRAGDHDEYMAHTITGKPLIGSEATECESRGWLVEDDEITP